MAAIASLRGVSTEVGYHDTRNLVQKSSVDVSCCRFEIGSDL